MKFKRCEYGHYYDPSKYDRCPHCFARGSGLESEYTVAKQPLDERVMQAYDLDAYDAPVQAPARPKAPAPQAPVPPAAPVQPAVPVQQAPAQPMAAPAQMEADEVATVARLATDAGIDPPVGFLIQITGGNKGKFYPIHSERNSIGRANGNDVVLKGDLGVSRESNAVLSYDPRARAFHLIPGEGKAIVYVNGEELLAPRALSSYDCVEISDTALLFLPFCGEKFAWEDLEK